MFLLFLCTLAYQLEDSFLRRNRIPCVPPETQSHGTTVHILQFHQLLTLVDRHSKLKVPFQRNKRERKSTRIGLIERLLPKFRVRSSGVPKYTTKPSPRGLNFNLIVSMLRASGFGQVIHISGPCNVSSWSCGFASHPHPG